MKTTLNIDDHLLRRAKKVAAERGTTLTAVIEEALRSSLTRPGRRTPYRFDWVTVRGSEAPDVDISDRDALYEWMQGRR